MSCGTGQSDWFRAALATEAESRFVEVDGCPIHYRIWPEAGCARRGMLFVHGSAAHARWWDHIAPSFVKDHAVAALDLAGMGDSGRRPRYSIHGFASEIAAVLRDAGFLSPQRPRPVVVAHSFGGFATAHLALASPETIGGFVIVDSHLAVPDHLRIPAHSPFTTVVRTYATEEEALARFRLIPAQPVPDAHILDHITRHSLRRTDDGWTWKFEGIQLSEDNVGTAMFREMGRHLRDIRTPAALIYGERSVLVGPAIARHIAVSFPSPIPLVEIPNGHHHLMLDQPLALIGAIRGLLAGAEFKI